MIFDDVNVTLSGGAVCVCVSVCVCVRVSRLYTYVFQLAGGSIDDEAEASHADRLAFLSALDHACQQ
jgi:hypothetical protein